MPDPIHHHLDRRRYNLPVKPADGPVKVAVYSICYNESLLLPYFFRHYRTFASKIVIYDNESTDDSADIILKNGGILKTYSTDNEVHDGLMKDIKNNCWKECRPASGEHYDFVLICDIDEFFYHQNIHKFLKQMLTRKRTLIKPQGYQMISNKLPIHETQLYDLNEYRYGIVGKDYSKPCLFDPNKIEEINYVCGAHVAHPTGKVVRQEGGCMLLHYSMLSKDWYLDRIKKRGERLSQFNKDNRLALRYLDEIPEISAKYDKTIKKAKKII